jgi:hypothetical protein
MRLFKIYYGPDSYRDSRRMTYDTATSLVFGGEAAELEPDFTL